MPGSSVVLIVGSGAAGAATERAVRETSPGSEPRIVAPVGLADALSAAAPADGIALLLAGTELAPGWLEGLEAVAGADARVATVSALRAGAAWGPTLTATSAAGWPEAAASVRKQSLRRRPRLLSPHWPCVLVRRASLELVGIPDGSPAAFLAELGERSVAAGLVHALADDVFVRGPAGALDAEEERRLTTRWPHRPLARELDADPSAPPHGAALAAGRDLEPISVTLDGRALGPRRAGTEVHSLELILALARTERLSLRVVTPPDLAEDARERFAAVPGLELLPYAAAAAGPQPPTAIVHRPSQVFTPDDLALLVPLGKRLVVTHQDLIAYRSPAYHAGAEAWAGHRRATRAALAAADHAVFFSRHALDDALADDLVDPRSATVVLIGTDHATAAREPQGRRPAALGDDGRPFLLCLGAALPHKNHTFAERLHAALRDGEGWDGRLVFAGPAGTEAGSGADRPDPLHLGQVDEAEKAWLLANAAAVVYPTVSEGFGLVPFEAGRAGTPCLFAAVSSLAEVLPAELATLVPWNAEASAGAVRPLLQAGPARRRLVDGLRAAADRHTWDAAAQALLEVYGHVLTQPVTEARRGARDRLALEQRLREVHHERELEFHRFAAFRDEVGADGLGLVGPGGILAPADQRALIAIASRDAVRRPLLAALRAAYGVARRLR